MNASEPRDGRDLIGRLSDGTLTAEEMAQLNALLSEDPIAQEAYLDHMLIDGLLEREFSGSKASPVAAERKVTIASSRTGRLQNLQFRSSWLAWSTATAACVVGGAMLWWANTNQPSIQSLPLVAAGFEGGAANQVPSFDWQGDVADVVGKVDGISPRDGSHMLRFVRSEAGLENACELYQVIDLSRLSGKFHEGNIAVEATAFFNAIPELEHDDCLFSLTVFAATEEWTLDRSLRSELPTVFGGNQTRADDDAASWQQVKTRVALPPGAKYLIVQLAVIRTDETDVEDFSGQFADSVALCLVKS